MFCFRCGKELPDEMAFCPFCGAKAVVSTEAVSQKTAPTDGGVDTENRMFSERAAVSFRLFGKTISIDSNRDSYNHLRNQFLEIANNSSSLFQQLYAQNESLDDVIKNATHQARQAMLPALEQCRKILVEHKVYSLSTDSFFDKYVSPYEAWSEAYDSLSDQYAEIVLTNEQQHEYRRYRRESRGKWEGGGFGLKGSLKGAATAGALNMVEGVGHSVFNFIGNIASDFAESNKKDAIFNNPQTIRSLRLALWKTVFAMHFSISFCLKEEVGDSRFADGMADIDSKTTNMLKNLELITTPAEKETVLLQVLDINPYSTEWYVYVYNTYGDPDGELERIANYFGISVVGDYKEKELKIFSDKQTKISEEDARAALDEVLKKKTQMNYLRDSATVAELQRLVERLKKSKEILARAVVQNCLAAGPYHVVGLKIDETIVVAGANKEGECNVTDWRDISAVCAGYYHTVGLKNNGSVIATKWKRSEHDMGQCNVSNWKDIVAIAAGSDHTIGLKKDGTVVATGADADGQCNVRNWSDITAVSAGMYHSLGLKSDGTVVSTEYVRGVFLNDEKDYGQTKTGRWRDIVAISAGMLTSLGIKTDGTVIAIGCNSEGQCEVGNWRNIIAVSGGLYHSVGLKDNGTVVCTKCTNQERNYGQFDVEKWTDIVAIFAGTTYTIGLKSDGSLVTAGLRDSMKKMVDEFKLFANYKNIAQEKQAMREEKVSKRQKQREDRMKLIQPVQSILAAKAFHTVGLKSDGSVVVVGSERNGKKSVSNWRNIVAVAAGGNHTLGLKEDGTVISTKCTDADESCGQDAVQHWTDVIQISGDYFHTLGLKSDGTVMSTRCSIKKADHGQCDVQTWKNIVAVSAGGYHSLGLNLDGTVSSTEYQDPEQTNMTWNHGQCDVQSWSNIVAISAGMYHSLGLKSDGTVVAVGFNREGQCEVENWKDIVSIFASKYHSVGLKADGTVVSTIPKIQKCNHGQADVSGWSNIVAISAGIYHTVGLKEDGTLVATKCDEDQDYGQCNVEGIKLFNSLRNLDTERTNEMANRKILDKKINEWKEKGVCLYCGGQFKGFFTKKCANCGREKNY